MGGTPFAMVPLPAERSMEKPRRKGFTMMMDWGLPVNQQRDWLDLIAPYVDLAKFVVGTARMYDEDYLLQKIALYKNISYSGTWLTRPSPITANTDS